MTKSKTTQQYEVADDLNSLEVNKVLLAHGITLGEIKEQNKNIVGDIAEIKRALQGNGKPGVCERVAVHDSYFKMMAAMSGITLTAILGIIIKVFF